MKRLTGHYISCLPLQTRGHTILCSQLRQLPCRHHFRPANTNRTLILGIRCIPDTIAKRHFHAVSGSEINRGSSSTQQLFDLSVRLSRSSMSGPAELLCTVFSANGTFHPVQTRLKKVDLAHQYELDGRDLRSIDLVSESIPHFVVRPSTIIISLFTLRLLVQSDRVLLFHNVESNGAAVNSNIQDLFVHDFHSRFGGTDRHDLPTHSPYELRAVEAALASVTATLGAEYALIREEAERILNGLNHSDTTRSVLRELLQQRKKLATIEQHARQMRSALQELLDSDEDMAAMYLSDRAAERPHQVQDHQEVEYLLEAYDKHADALVESARAMLETFNRTEESIRSVLDVRRNQLMVFEAKVEIYMLALAAPTLLAGVYGMNMVNYLEDSQYAFGCLAAACTMGTVLISRYGLRQLRNIRKVNL